MWSPNSKIGLLQEITHFEP